MDEFIRIENLPEIDDCLKVRINGGSNGFCGFANCYVNESKFQLFCELLKGFPTKIGQSISFSSGRRDDISYFEISLKSKSTSGKVTVNVCIVHNKLASTPFTATFSFEAEPAAIDRFYQSMNTVSKVGSVGAVAVLSNET